MWRTVKLGDVCTIVNGGTPKSNVKNYWDGDIKWLTPKDMGKLQDKYVRNTERQITAGGLANSSAKLVPENSIIFSCRAPIGHVFINDCEMSFNQGCKGLIPSKDLLVEYLYYFLFASKKLLNDLGTGATFKEISGKTLSNVTISIPPLAEQQRIVEKLDAAFAEIDRAIDAASNKSVLSLELEKNFLESCFDEEKFESDCVYRLEQVVKFSSGNTPSKKNPDFWEGEFPWISAKDLKAEQIGNSLDKITKYAIETRAAKIAPKGSLLVLVRGMGLLNGIALGELQRDCAFNQDIKALTPDASLNPRFLLLTLKARFLSLDAYLTSAAHGTAKIDFERIKKTKVLVPPLNQQLELVERYDGLVRKCKILLNTAQSTLHQLSMLKSAILTEELQPSEAA